MLLEAAFLACWPNISKYVGEHCVDASQPTENCRGGKQWLIFNLNATA